jgi:hypothetical protein
MLNPSEKFLSSREIRRNAVGALVITALFSSAAWCVFEVDSLFEGSVFQDVRHLLQLMAVFASPLPIFLWLFMVATPIIDNWRLKSPINLSISRNRVRYTGAGRFAGRTGVVHAAEKQSFSSEAELIADPDHLGSLISQALCECNARLVWSGNKVGNKVIKLVTHSAGDTHSSR